MENQYRVANMHQIDDQGIGIVAEAEVEVVVAVHTEVTAGTTDAKGDHRKNLSMIQSKINLNRKKNLEDKVISEDVVGDVEEVVDVVVVDSTGVDQDLEVENPAMNIHPMMKDVMMKVTQPKVREEIDLVTEIQLDVLEDLEDDLGDHLLKVQVMKGITAIQNVIVVMKATNSKMVVVKEAMNVMGINPEDRIEDAMDDLGEVVVEVVIVVVIVAVIVVVEVKKIVLMMVLIK